MGMIRVSDHAEKIIKEQANGRTISATVDALLAGGQNLDKEYFDNKFREQQEALREMRSLIEDTTVDRVESGGPKNYVSGSVKVYVPWEVARELFFEFLPDDAPEYIGSASEQVHQADEEFPVYIQDNWLWTENAYSKSPILDISPRVQQFLESHK